ncbi:urease accessory UreF family protein [Dietzia sp. KRD202]|jgi:urease accessory protein|uniref:urease accessory protein UreF n=1 Tax=Dietzia sp. KRD202 TaxID=2729732 RepID=UPI0019D0ACB5|nr:urease accessory UreF family protein [Dietzia sp. KRD202]
MTSPSRIELLLNADPAFAAGAGSFSSGLETLVADGWATSPAELAALLDEALVHRWNSFDRVFLDRAFRCDATDALLALDDELDLHLIGEAARKASRRAGGALLGVWARLGDTRSALLRRVCPAGTHLPVAQAAVGRARGLELADIEALSGWQVISSYSSSAVRLGAAGHRSIQELMTRAASRLDDLLALPVPDGARPTAWTPKHDIAAERHRHSDLRLFAS